MTATLLINIDVDDLERAIAFYTMAFSLKIGRRFGSFAAELTGGTSPIYLLVKPDDSPASPATSERRRYARHWTPIHLDIVVDDLDVAIERAQAAGATLETEPVTHVWGRIAQLADPFGHGLCLIQFLGRGYDEIATH